MSLKSPPFADIEVVAPNFNRRYSGVTSTIVRLIPLQAERVTYIAAEADLKRLGPE